MAAVEAYRGACSREVSTTGLYTSPLCRSRPPSDWESTQHQRDIGQPVLLRSRSRVVVHAFAQRWSPLGMFGQTQPIRGRYEQRSLLQTCLRLRTIWDTMANRDWSGHQIYNPSD